MPRHEAIKALDIYKRAGQQAIRLSDFYEVCSGLDLARNFHFPVLREPPQSFLETMEEYIREAPRMVSVSSETLDYPEKLMLTYKQEDAFSPPEDIEVSSDKPKPPPSDDIAVSNVMAASPSPPNNLDTEDLLLLNVTKPDASVIEESNALALAIVTSGTTPFDSDASQAKDFDPNGWELALVSTATNDLSSSQERQLAGGLDSLTLSSLYDEATYRASQQPAYGTPAPNPFEVADPFAMSNIITLPVVQVASFTQHPTNPFASFQPDFPQPEQQQHPSTGTQQNTFGDTGFKVFPSIPTAHPQTTNPFGRTGLLQ